MSELENYKQVGKDLYNKIRLLTSPVAIKFIKDFSEIPENAHRPSKMGQKISLCQAFTLARRWGLNVAMTFEDNICITSSLVHQWEKVPVEDIFISQVKSGYHKDSDAELKIQMGYRDVFNEESFNLIKDHKGFIASPLIKTVVIPDVILLYGDPAQMLHIIHSLSYEGKYIVESKFIGYGESCIKGVLLPYISKKPQLVLPGTGDRLLSVTKEEEMAIGFPSSLLFYISENLFKSAGALNPHHPPRFILGTPPAGPAAWSYLKRKMKKYKRKKEKKIKLVSKNE
ncbi:MAG: DUF169 domain-containing protein [Candidatus Hodarchaeota archaeon]